MRNSRDEIGESDTPPECRLEGEREARWSDASIERNLDRLERGPGRDNAGERRAIGRKGDPMEREPRLEGDEARRYKERERLESRIDKARHEAWARERLEDIVRSYEADPKRGSCPRDELERDDRIEERSGMRHLPGFDVRRERQREDLEIRLNPEGFVSRQEGGLDAATERRIALSELEHRARRRRQE